MTIDILKYELKYKNDKEIMDLIRSYHELFEESKDYELMQENSESKIDDLEGTITDLKEQIESYADDIDIFLDDLTEGDNDKKKLAIQGLEKLVERMRL